MFDSNKSTEKNIKLSTESMIIYFHLESNVRLNEFVSVWELSNLTNVDMLISQLKT